MEDNNNVSQKGIEDQAKSFIKSGYEKLNNKDKKNTQDQAQTKEKNYSQNPQISTEQAIEMARLGLRKYYQTYRPNFPMYEFLIDAFCKSTLACCKKYNLDKSADLPIEVVSVGSGVILFAPIVQDFRAGKIKLKKNRVDEQPDNVVKENKDGRNNGQNKPGNKKTPPISNYDLPN